jgi:hypothetical protein
MRARLKGVTFGLLLLSFLACIGIAVEGRLEHGKVVDAVVYGGRLAADGFHPINTAFVPSDGSAAIGINYRFAASGRWAIEPFRTQTNATRWLYVSAETPEFFSAVGYDRIYVGDELIGEIRAIPNDGTAGFAADREQQTILMPPARTFGYRFALPQNRSCTPIACNVTILGAWTFWHVYRFAIVGESPRFAATGNA